MSTTAERVELPARTHAQAAELFRRPFALGAIGFRAMMKVPLNGNAFGGAQAAVHMACRLIISLPVTEGSRDLDAVYEDVG